MRGGDVWAKRIHLSADHLRAPMCLNCIHTHTQTHTHTHTHKSNIYIYIYIYRILRAYMLEGGRGTVRGVRGKRGGGGEAEGEGEGEGD